MTLHPSAPTRRRATTAAENDADLPRDVQPIRSRNLMIGSAADTIARLRRATPARCYPDQLAASEATVTSIVDEDRAQAIRFSDCRRSSIAWKAAAWAREA